MKKQSKYTPNKIALDLSYGDLPANHPFVRPAGFDPTRFPWKIDSESVTEAFSAFLFQRIPARDRGPFMDELYRVLVTGAKATFIVPYYSSARAIQDPTTEWPPLCEQSFLYFNKKFREDNKLPYPFKSDFDFSYGYSLDNETALRTDDTRPFWIKHYANTVNDLNIVLVKKPPQ